MDTSLYNDNYNIICDCKNILRDKDLFINGLQCKCGITSFKLSGLVKRRVTYIITNTAPTLHDVTDFIYIGTCAAGNLKPRLKMHKTNKLLDFSKHKIFITYLHSEYILIKLFKPNQNILPNGDTSMTLPCNNYKVLDYKNLPYINNTKTCYIPDHSVLLSCGIIFENIDYMKINTTKCFIKDAQVCTCNIPCEIRKTLNTFTNLPIYHPIPIDMVKKHILHNKNIDFTIGNTLNIKSKEFLLEIINRNKDITEATKKSYRDYIALIYKFGFLDNKFEDFNTVYNWLINDVFIHYARTTNVFIINILCVIFSQTSNKERFILWGKNWLNIRKNLLSFFTKYSNSISNEKTIKENKNWLDYPELLNIVEKERKAINNNSTLLALQHYISLMLHVKHSAVRNDYSSVMLWGYNENKNNYLLSTVNGKMKFIFNEYKTSNIYGRIESPIVNEDVSKDLLILLNYKKLNNSKFLFEKLDGSMMDRKVVIVKC